MIDRITFSLNAFKKVTLFANIFVLCTAFSPFITEDGMNILLIAVMIVTIIVYGNLLLKFNKQDWPVYLLPLTLLITGIFHFNSFRYSSYLYGTLFILFYIINLHLIRSCIISIKQYQKFIAIMIYSFFAVLFIQQVMYFLGIENFFNKIFAIGFKFNSLATEPSYAATVIVVLFYSYISLKRIQNSQKYKFRNLIEDKFLWFAFTYQMLTFGSSYGILFFAILLVSFIDKMKYFIYIAVLIFIIFYICMLMQFEPAVRLSSIIKALTNVSSDYSNLIEADHSASVRIIPIFLIFNSLNYITPFGMGMDFTISHFSKLIVGVPDGAFSGGLLPAFIIDNGVFNSFILYIVIKKYAIRKIMRIDFFIFLIMLLNTSFNSQLFWAILTILTLNSYLGRRPVLQKLS